MIDTKNEKHLCPVGFVVDAPKLNSKGKEECRGTKHFAPGEKVYVLPMKSYDIAHYERTEVAGYHREDGKLSVVWIDLRRLENFNIDEIDDSDLVRVFNHKLGNSSAKPWTTSEAKQFINWRNRIEAPDWEEKNQKNVSKKPNI